MNPNLQSKLGFLAILGLCTFGMQQCYSYHTFMEQAKYAEKYNRVEIICRDLYYETKNPKIQEICYNNNPPFNGEITPYLEVKTCQEFIDIFNKNTKSYLTCKPKL